MSGASRSGVLAGNSRLESLDVFRGLTVALMVLVNNPGSWGHVHPPFRHAAWHGCTPTDLVFPFFLFIVGVAIPLAILARRARGVPDRVLVKKILRRGAVLWGLGLLLALSRSIIVDSGLRLDPRAWDWAHLRILGVLPRIGITYALAALLALRLGARGLEIVAGGILLAYWPLMALLSHPDHPPEPGASPIDAPETHLGAFVDQSVLGQDHLWVGSKVYDPEGILSTFPALATVLLGVLAGLWIRRFEIGAPRRVGGLFLAGLVATGLGLLWSRWFPLNKPLWTSSFVLFTGGLALCLLGLLHALVDLRGLVRPFRPLKAYGVNALLVFFASPLVAISLRRWTEIGAEKRPLTTWLYEVAYRDGLGLAPADASLLHAATWMLGWGLVLWLLLLRGWVWKV